MTLIDFDSNLRNAKHYQQNVILWPDRWHSFSAKPALVWRKTKLLPDNALSVPEERGIYALIVQFQDEGNPPAHLPPHGYIMYAGITGHDSENRTLRARFRDYLREKRRGKRVQIWNLLNKWHNDIFFYYAEVENRRKNLRKLEIALNDAVIPPYVTKDFSAKVRRLVRTLRTN